MNILIVDDNTDDVFLTRRWLERNSHTVAHAATGADALAVLAADPLPDLVLLDVMLPRIDGFTVLRRLRADPRTQKLPVIILSSFDRHEDVARGLELGANDYIVKPPMEFQFLGRIARFAPKA